MYVVIMAGGKGTRFWPRSRAAKPKQLLDIISSKTMIQETVERIEPLVDHDRIIVVTNKQQAQELKAQLPQLPAENIIAEPFGRNTAACICLAATWIHQRDPEAVMAVLPADHYIADREAFYRCIHKAEEAARTHSTLITIGIKPQAPETGYGYIEFDRQLDGESQTCRVTCFHEKPDAQKAAEYLQKGNYLWNSGMFVWKVSTILQEIEKHLPELYSTITAIEPLWHTPDIEQAIISAYERTVSISIDYGVLEKTTNVLTLTGDFGWNDIGSWSAIFDLSPKDENENVLRGDVVAIDSQSNLVHSPKKLTAVVGVSNLIVVDTEDALLICDADKVQDVKGVVELLKEDDDRKKYL